MAACDDLPAAKRGDYVVRREQARVTTDEDAPPRRRIGRARGIAIGAASVLLVGLVGLWVERRPIAADAIDRYLAARGLAARYRIADLGAGRQRLVDVSVGDPAAPDLVADWIDTSTRLGLDGARVTGVRAGHVRVRARWVDGRLSLGSLDRLLPASTGGATRLPAIDLDVGDARARVETPAGVIGIVLTGAGRLDGGFRGRLGAAATRLAEGGCIAEMPSAALAVRVEGGRPTLAGPVRASRIVCRGVAVAAAAVRIAATGDAALARWTGDATLSLRSIADGNARVVGMTGSVGFAGGGRDLAGSVAVTTGVFAAGPVRGAGAGLAGRYAWRGSALALADGAQVSATGLRWTGAAPSARIAGWARAAAGTPVAPLLARMAGAVDAAARSIDVTAHGGATLGGDGPALRLSDAVLHSRSGASAAWRGTATGPDAFDGTATLDGGGLPAGSVRIARTGGVLAGTAMLRPYQASGASLRLDPVRFRVDAAGTASVATRAILSGPLAGGRIVGASLPIVVRRDRAGRLAIDPACTPLAVDRLRTGGLMLAGVRLTLCPIGPALVTLDRGRVGGGARTGPVRLAGRLGSGDLAITAAGASVGFGTRALAVRDLAVRLGAADQPTLLDVAALDGTIRGGGVAGSFQGAGGRIGAVPLLLSEAAGSWSFAGGALALSGGLTVADTDTASPRFRPLPAHDVTFRLADGRIMAAGTLVAPGASGRTVAAVTLAHDLATGAGHAELAVPGLAFDRTLQPEALTPVTLGVVADVAGTVTGEGHIAWTGDGGLSSTGAFRTAGLDLAAAFGPVAGIAGEIRFVDLLGLRSAPDQRLTVREVNPGVPIDDGVVRFELPGGSAIRVAGADWPFAGGGLALAPTLLDFDAVGERSLTFRVTGVDARRFLAQFGFKNLDATGIFDGVLPIRFDASGGRIEGGDLTVRAGGGSIAYVGELSRKDLGFWPNLAFQALKSLRYRRLSIAMDGPLAGELVTQVRFAGISEGQGARSNFLIRRLERLPFVFDVQIKAPFRGLIDSAQSFYDPRLLIERNLPALLGVPASAASPVQPPPVQGGESARGTRETTLTTGHDGPTVRPMMMPTIMGLATIGLVLLTGGCVTVNAPDKPIQINLTISVTQEVVYRLDNQAKSLIQQNPGIF
ncbi:YnbE family lipoprotein [uncultured Sphingomonas sp.]|uniref:YnbE family lipoprotein n=1 Tax=uncultured Sphingomonas sp. TaxID=158754 RepID=UPI0035CB8EEA